MLWPRCSAGRELPDGQRGAVDGQGGCRSAGTANQRRGPGGSGGSGRQRVLALAIMSARFPGMMIAAVPPGPNDAEADIAPLSLSRGDGVQHLPSADQVARRLAVGPVPAASSAARPWAVRISRRTVTSWRARAAGTAGPVACQFPSERMKMPAVPGRAQAPASTGIPDG